MRLRIPMPILLLTTITWVTSPSTAADFHKPDIETTEDFQRWLVGTVWTNQATSSIRIYQEDVMTRKGGRKPFPFKVVERRRVEVTSPRTTLVFEFDEDYQAYTSSYRRQRFEFLERRKPAPQPTPSSTPEPPSGNSDPPALDVETQGDTMKPTAVRGGRPAQKAAEASGKPLDLRLIDFCIRAALIGIPLLVVATFVGLLALGPKIWAEQVQKHGLKRFIMPRIEGALSAGLMASGIFLLVASPLIYNKAKAMKSRPRTEGRIQSASVEETGGTQSSGTRSYYPVVRYGYFVDGRFFAEEARISVSQVGSFEFRDAKAWVGSHPLGSTIPVFYNPTHPAESVLEIGAYGNGLLHLVVGCVLMLFSVPLFRGMREALKALNAPTAP